MRSEMPKGQLQYRHAACMPICVAKIGRARNTPCAIFRGDCVEGKLLWQR
jgi:hypothetical protein